jgi:hypothetical protein
VLQSGHFWRQVAEVIARPPRSSFFRLRGALSLCRAAIEQFRQPCEIDCHLSRLVYRQEAGVSCNVWVGSTVEHAELLPGGVLDGESARDLGDPPRRRKATGHGRFCLAARGFRGIGSIE